MEVCEGFDPTRLLVTLAIRIFTCMKMASETTSWAFRVYGERAEQIRKEEVPFDAAGRSCADALKYWLPRLVVEIRRKLRWSPISCYFYFTCRALYRLPSK